MGHQDDYEALRQLITAAVLVTLGAGEEAVHHLRVSISLGQESEDELCIPVFASYELGLLLSSRNEVCL